MRNLGVDVDQSSAEPPAIRHGRHRGKRMTSLEYTVSSQFADGRGVARCKEAKVPLDAALEGRSDAFNPAELLLAALAACMTKSTLRAASVNGFEVRAVEVRLKAIRQDSPPRMARIEYELFVDTDGPDRRLDLIHRNVCKFWHGDRHARGGDRAGRADRSTAASRDSRCSRFGGPGLADLEADRRMPAAGCWSGGGRHWLRVEPGAPTPVDGNDARMGPLGWALCPRRRLGHARPWRGFRRGSVPRTVPRRSRAPGSAADLAPERHHGALCNLRICSQRPRALEAGDIAGDRHHDRRARQEPCSPRSFPNSISGSSTSRR